MDFKQGDVVQLKSGGPLMTVAVRQDGGDYWCVWFNTSKEGTSEIKGASLEGAVLRKA